MIATVPEISQEEVREILRELAAGGVSIPEPQSVKIEAGEDHDGDPAFFMTVTFAKRHKPEDIPWKRISPLVTALRRRVFAKGGETRFVYSDIRRLGEKLPKA